MIHRTSADRRQHKLGLNLRRQYQTPVTNTNTTNKNKLLQHQTRVEYPFESNIKAPLAEICATKDAYFSCNS